MEKSPTLADVARAAGVSRSTAARAMSGSGYVDKVKRQLIEETAIQLGYRGSAIARTLRTQRSHTVGILIADITNPIFPRIVRGADEVLTKEGITLLLCNTEGQPARQAAFVREMMERLADGLILVSQSVDRELVETLRHGPPTVFVNRTPEPGAFDYVGPDNRQGIDLLLDHLTGLGHRRIAYITGPPDSSTARDRHSRFLERMERLGLTVPDHAVVTGGYAAEHGRSAADALLSVAPEDRPTAVIASNDFVALGLIERAQELGFSVPRDMSVTGYDNTFWDAIWHRAFPDAPRMTTIEQPRRDIGHAAARLLLDRLGTPDRTPRERLSPVSMIVGNTTTPPHVVR
ncbi:LacI family DNA-binding transcriptional regulator [uncultured Jannaschia sp.]|uniref:LacI family DNA-binding transcriptional regulator n=1 Tax=uncultured Jannaschia sp. TaxID=293347 RepID=UPI00262A4DBF|nr:LacI family DNA-binding transcriptional regulator [uncultured Jannaschia sp.]